jgi:hypothetical protein
MVFPLAVCEKESLIDESAPITHTKEEFTGPDDISAAWIVLLRQTVVIGTPSAAVSASW